MNAKLAELHRVTLVNRVVEINPDGTVCLTQRFVDGKEAKKFMDGTGFEPLTTLG